MNKHTYPHDYHDYPHNVPLINNLLHDNNTRDYKPFTSGSRYKKVIGAQQIPFLYRKSLITRVICYKILNRVQQKYFLISKFSYIEGFLYREPLVISFSSAKAAWSE